MLSGMQKVTFCLRAVLVFGSVRENRASSSWNVFGGSSRECAGGNDVLRMSFSRFVGICEVRATSGVGRISELRGPVRVSCVLRFGAFSG